MRIRLNSNKYFGKGGKEEINIKKGKKEEKKEKKKRRERWVLGSNEANIGSPF